MYISQWIFCILIISIVNIVDSAQKLRFANYYDSQMVLQMAPSHAQVWGYASTIGDHVIVKLNSTIVANVTVHRRTDGGTGGIWSALLPPQTASGPSTLQIQSRDGHVVLTDVLFGDVWICSGQSNMEFQMRQVFNHTQELQRAAHFSNIRIMKVTTTNSSVLLAEPAITSLHKWDKPGTGPSSQYFSALCLLYAMQIAPHINRPIGLVDTSYGGTPIEAWMSPESLTTCLQHKQKRGPSEPNVLWNAMVYPLLNMTIYGAIWYQGESNAGRYEEYACLFPTMIDDWRHRFNVGSRHQTSNMFPFGFVQLAAYRNETHNRPIPDLRWAQTARYGYVPNTRMKKVFMAAAMDLPDFLSPYGAIHPRDKLDVAERLALAGRAVAYGETNLDYQGPIPSTFTLDATTTHTLRIEFDHGNSPIEVRDKSGFEVCCTKTPSTKCTTYSHWEQANLAHHDDTSVTIDVSTCHGQSSVVNSVRYIWRESPCHFKMCPIYGRDNDIPAPIFQRDAPF